MNELKIFENAEFGAIRTAEIDNDVWFVGKDVAEVLGYTNPSKALIDHVDDEDKLNNETLLSLGQRGGWLINESGLYSLVLSSKLPSAKAFKRWVTSEVLPSLRKNGGYINNVDLVMDAYFSDIPDDQKTLVKNMLNSIEQKQKRISSLTNQNVVLAKENDILVQRNLEWADRALINALVRAYAHTLNDDYSTAWNNFKKELLYKYSININSRITHHLNTYGKKTKPKTLEMLHDDEIPNALSTIVAMCRESNADIDELLANTAVD